MNLGTYDATIDFSKLFVHNSTSIYFKEGDLNTAKVRAKLTMQGKSIDITGCNIVVKIETMTGQKINDVATIIDATNGIVEIDFKSNSLVEGTNFFELKIVKGESVKESPKLAYRVLDSIEDAGSIEGTNEYPILIKLINDTNKAIEDANEALELANTMKTNLEEVIDNANSAISNATDATNNANTAATNATSKITEVDNAKNDMTTKVDESIDTMKSEVTVAKNDMKITVDEAIKLLKQEYNSLTAQQQQELELLQARDGEVNLNARLERDLAKGKIIYETVEDSYINANDTLDSYIQNVEIKGNTIQNESDLSDIKSVGDKVGEQELYKIPIVCRGKNLFNGKLERGHYDTKTGNEALSTNARCADFIRVNSNSKISLFRENTNGDTWILEYDANKKFLKTSFNSLTTLSSTRYIKFYIASPDFPLDCKIVVNYGTQATSYEPYQEHKLNILSPTPIEKVGDVEDRIIEKDGVWGIEKNIVNHIFDGSEIWYRYGNGQKELNCYHTFNSSIISEPVICDKFKYIPWVWDSEVNDGISGHSRGAVYVAKQDINSLVDWINWLKANKLNVKYITSNPQFIPLPEDQQVKLRTFANQTNISFLTEVEGTIKADVAKSISASVNSNTQEISDLWDFVLKNNLANFAVALNALDTKLRLEQLTKTPR